MTLEPTAIQREGGGFLWSPKTSEDTTGFGIGQIKIAELRNSRGPSLALFIRCWVFSLCNAPENFDRLVAR